MKNSKRRVFVGMSGGVDSSVSAALLKKQGFDVTGVFVKVWQPPFMECTWKDERRDAMRVCAHLDIRFLTLDLEKEYKKEVVDYMIEEYKKGNTPNPDVMCNKHIKFGAFVDWAISKGANFIATGHYAKTRHEYQNEANDTNHYLLKSKDLEKDQTYFLWTLKQKQLSKTLFPVGAMKKSEVRRLAKKFKLSNAEKKDSQGLCFVGKIDMKDFLSHFIKQKQGMILNEKGRVIGTHEGALFYTLGQRHGLKINKNAPTDLAYFVVSKNMKNNTLTVSTKVKPLQNKRKINLRDVNFINRPKNKEISCDVRVRYRGKLRKAKVKPLQKNKAELVWRKVGELVARGQSIVFYKGSECLGGGIVC